MGAYKSRILVVDDEPRLVASLRDLMAAQGHEVAIATGGRQAMELLREREFELVLLDLMMADHNGHQVMDFIAENKIDITVIVVSGDTLIDSAIESLRRGAFDFFRKPYEPQLLVQSVENAIKKRRLERENRSMRSRLQHSERLYRYMVDSSPDIVYMLDSEGRFTFLNERVETVLGYRRGELIGKHYSELVHNEDLELARYTFNERRGGQRAARHVELRLKCKDDSCPPRYFETNTLAIELSSMGMYADQRARQPRRFVGTYGVARDVTERKKAEEIITYQAYHDLLTGLPNRALFKDRLNMAIAQARRNHQVLAVMCLDLDRFKVVNDTLGHVTGDELLQAVAGRLKGCIREGDTLARIGGDEFMLLLPQVASRDDAAQIARHIIGELKQPFRLEDRDVFASVSIGIALFPFDGKTCDTLIKNADIAMYYTKGRGKDGFCFYADHMDGVFAQHLSLESDMRKALAERQFTVYYQPQVHAASGTVVGMEALLRWQHPTRGLLGPSEFIPLAEETGLIVPLGQALLRAACSQAREWRDLGLGPIRLAVNLSAVEIEQPRLVETVIEILEQTGLPGSALEIEITENVLMKDIETVVRKLRKLRSHGITVAIDDFGTGYSSLSYLQKLPIHTLKIDRSFVQDITPDLEESSIVAAIVAMAKGLGLNVIAEGVETEFQFSHLLSLGCAEMQGFWFSRSLEPADAQKLLAGRHFPRVAHSD